MKSIFNPLKKEGFTTLKIRYDWKKDQIRLEVMKEWERGLDFSTYNKEFYMDDILTEDIQYLNTDQVRELYKKYEMEDYLGEIIAMVKAGRHFGLECYYNEEYDIRFICHQHCRKTGNNNRRHALYLDGIRRCEPEEDEIAIIREGLNVSRSMSFKLLAADLKFGGSKTMVQMRPLNLDNLKCLGFIAYAFDKTRCMTGADMKFPTALADVENEHFSMNFTSGPKSPLGESGKPTAHGVYITLKKAVLFKEGTDSLEGKKVVLMGLGSVGWHMGEELLRENVKLYAADINSIRVQEFIKNHSGRDIEAVAVEDALYLDVDIVSPCAVGNLINRENIDKLRCSYIWGSANNLIKAGDSDEEIKIADFLARQNILFQPEWWYNTGGVLCAAQEYMEGENATYEKLVKLIDEILPYKTWNNLNEAKKLGITPTENAYRVCQDYIYSK